MTNIQDATASVSIYVLAQGFADITNLVANPNPSLPNATVVVTPTITNTGAADTLWRKVYRDGSLVDTVTASIGAGATWSSATYSFTMGSAATVIRVDCGHYLGTSTQVLDDTMSVTVAYQAYPSAAFTGTITYSPSQTVEPTTNCTIGYTIKNNGGPGTLWAGLYDLATPTPNLIGGYVEVAVAAGATATESVTVTVNAAFTGQLLAGHIQ